MEATDPSAELELELYTIPAQSSWFLWDDIHDIERREFEEFFSESSITRTPKVYKEYRDFIINKFREDTSRTLSFTSIRKFLVGDVNLLHKVFLFLQRWGLINFGSSLNKDDHVSLLDNAKFELGTPPGIRVTATPNSLRPITAPPPVEERAETAIKLPPLTSYSDVFTDLNKPHHVLLCAHCKEPCDSSFYQHNKSIANICDKCFKNGNVGENNAADDFKLIQNSATASPVWTEEEILLLLESVLKHGDDWELIAQSVSTKTRLDCISKLIELPFGEFLMGSASGRLNEDETRGHHLSPSHTAQRVKTDGREREETETGEEKEDHVDEDEPPAKKKRVALISDGDTSLMKKVAAMASKVGPSVAKAAAKAAIAALCDEASCPKEIFDTGDYISSAVDRANGDNDTDMEEQQEEKDGAQGLPVALRIRASVATALGAAAAQAKILADQEEREMEELAATVIDQQLKKLQGKLKFLDHLEMIMDAEEEVIEGVKETILQERISVLQCAFSSGITKRWDHTYVK